MEGFYTSSNVKWEFSLVYFIITAFVIILSLWDVSLLFFGALMVGCFFVNKQIYHKIVLIIISEIYLILSFFFAVQLDPLLAFQILTMQGSFGSIYTTYITIGITIVLGIAVGLYVDRLQFKYFVIIMLGISTISAILDITILTVIVDNYILNFMLHVVSYFMIYSLETVFWFLAVYGLILFLNYTVMEKETIVTIE
ncbi:MAG: hypothetical protein ACFFG0_10720 [Candidatus Thorarchaeota archaeon]